MLNIPNIPNNNKYSKSFLKLAREFKLNNFPICIQDDDKNTYRCDGCNHYGRMYECINNKGYKIFLPFCSVCSKTRSLDSPIDPFIDLVIKQMRPYTIKSVNKNKIIRNIILLKGYNNLDSRFSPSDIEHVLDNIINEFKVHLNEKYDDGKLKYKTIFLTRKAYCQIIDILKSVICYDDRKYCNSTQSYHTGDVIIENLVQQKLSRYIIDPREYNDSEYLHKDSDYFWLGKYLWKIIIKQAKERNDKEEILTLMKMIKNGQFENYEWDHNGLHNMSLNDFNDKEKTKKLNKLRIIHE